MAQTLRDRFSAGLSDVADTITRVASAIRRPQVTREAVLPGLVGGNGYGMRATANTSEELARALLSEASYFGKITNDAGPSMTRFSSYPATDLTPEKIVGAQQEATTGWPFRWAEMIEQVLDRDSHLSGIAQQRVDDVIKGTARLSRATTDPLAQLVRNFVDEVYRDLDTMREADAWLLGANAYGYAAEEITWKIDRVTFKGYDDKVVGPFVAVVPARFDAVHAKHFRFDMRTDEPLLWLGGDQISLPYGKFIFCVGEGAHPITERHGYMWPCVWLSMIRSLGIAGWASWVQRFGMPIPLVKYDGDITQYREHKQAYDEIIRNLGAGIGAVVPGDGFSVEFAQPNKGGTSEDPHSALADMCDSAQSVRVFGATLTTKIGNVGSFSASTTHAEVKYNKEEHDAGRLWAAKRRDLLGPIVRFNARRLAEAIRTTYPNLPCDPELIVRRVPRGTQRVPRDTDVETHSGVVSAAINEWGLPLSKESLYDRFDLMAPISDEDIAQGKPQQVSAGGKVVGSVEASNEGADAPVQPKQGAGEAPSSSSSGAEGDAAKKAPATSSRSTSPSVF